MIKIFEIFGIPERIYKKSKISIFLQLISETALPLIYCFCFFYIANIWANNQYVFFKGIILLAVCCIILLITAGISCLLANNINIDKNTEIVSTLWTAVALLTYIYFWCIGVYDFQSVIQRILYFVFLFSVPWLFMMIALNNTR